MGAPLETLISFDAKGMILENNGMSKSSSGSSMWNKAFAAQSIRRRQERREKIRRINRHGWSTRRPRICMVRKVRTLKKLVPNGKSVGLDGLFRETAHYIMSLETQVKVMQIMVCGLSGSSQ
ncbi:hypothetical protein IFM89_000075 [Coptis chinensis]|uniref:Uncharacterized protein n=1 Tax=Coptis chinensis TaxID=261450 RepID=A0A835MBX3_9MAGN|nr:hypothetical protein IFM89_000075 [Coptis chinensis]